MVCLLSVKSLATRTGKPSTVDVPSEIVKFLIDTYGLEDLYKSAINYAVQKGNHFFIHFDFERDVRAHGNFVGFWYVQVQQRGQRRTGRQEQPAIPDPLCYAQFCEIMKIFYTADNLSLG